MRAGLIVFLLLAVSTAYGQNDSIYVWNKWCARKDTLLLFNSGNNMIKVYCRSMKPREYKLRSLDRSLRIGTPTVKGDTMSVLAMPYPDKSRQMRLAIVSTKTYKTIKILDFSADDIPQPIARVGNIEGPEVTKKMLMKHTGLKVIFPNSLYAYPYVVTGYTLTDSTVKRVKKPLTVRTHKMVTAVMKAINEAVPDSSYLHFTNITAICPECATRELPDFKLKLKKD